MKQAYRILPVYTGDVSGVNAALYELGGMIVMHDPSGCNSTYNTHDETRWLTKDSLIFLTGLNEKDAILGNDDKLIRDITEAAELYHPAFIALSNSPIPYLNGTDFDGICRVLEKKTGLPVFHIPTNAMHDYTYGAGIALEEVAKRIPAGKKRESGRLRVNLLGMTPLDYANVETVFSVRRILEDAGMEVVSCWSMECSPEEIGQASLSDVNLVLSAVGLRAAKVLRERFGTPYVCGMPNGAFTDVLLQALRRSAECGENAVPYLERKTGSGAETAVIGDPVLMGSIAASLALENDAAIRLICPLETHEGLVGEGDSVTRGEEEVEQALKGVRTVIADPYYSLVLKAGQKLLRLPHFAFSGRTYRKEMPDLTRVQFRLEDLR